MKKYKTKTVQTEVRFIEEIRCNCCANLIGNHGPEPVDHISIDKRWGYSSSKDLTREQVDICEECWDDIISKFKIQPLTTEEHLV